MRSGKRFRLCGTFIVFISNDQSSYYDYVDRVFVLTGKCASKSEKPQKPFSELEPELTLVLANCTVF